MRLFVLAAGTGSRLFPLTKNTPMSLLDLGDGVSLLERQIETAISAREIDEIFIVTGYKSGQIEQKILEYKADIKVTAVFNPFFEVSNSLASLWCVNHLTLDQDFVITNGDSHYRNDILNTHVLCNDRPGIYLATSVKDQCDDDDMKVLIDDDGDIARVSKEIPLEEAQAESVGFVLVRGERLRQIYANKVVDLLKDKTYLNRFWLETFNAVAHDGVYTKTTEIPADAWSEVAFHPDIATIRNEISSRMFRTDT
ncbi:MAG: choline kinase [Planctomycetota bacterium]|jgi:choline kinase